MEDNLPAYTLKSGKMIELPALYVTPNHKMDAEILSLSKKRHAKGMKNINGICVSIKDYETIFNELNKSRLTEYFDPNMKKDSWIKIIDPSINILMSGTQNDKRELIETGLYPVELYGIYENVQSVSRPIDKTRYLVNNIYPLLDLSVIRNVLRAQLDYGSDYIISPSVPITSKTNAILRTQIDKALDMNRISRSLFDTVLRGSQQKNDYMNLLSISINAITPSNIDSLASLALSQPCDCIGVKPLNFSNEKIIQLQHFLTLIDRIKSMSENQRPIHIFNVNEFGYVCFCHGASVMISPIATDPYFKRSVSDSAPPRKGAYQHPIDMIPYPYDDFLDLSRHMNYAFPCHCEVCQKFQIITKIADKDWNRFRRIHFLLLRNMEIQELLDLGNSIKNALHDKFARSRRTAWLPFLE